jgi:hypothetical protein
MPRKATAKIDKPTKVKEKTSELANVKVTITHIVPTTQYGNVTYKAECDSSQVAKVGLLLTEVIGQLYPPYNPDSPLIHVPDEEATAFNAEASNLNEERIEAEQEATADEFDM